MLLAICIKCRFGKYFGPKIPILAPFAQIHPIGPKRNALSWRDLRHRSHGEKFFKKSHENV